MNVKRSCSKITNVNKNSYQSCYFRHQAMFFVMIISISNISSNLVRTNKIQDAIQQFKWQPVAIDFQWGILLECWNVFIDYTLDVDIFHWWLYLLTNFSKVFKVALCWVIKIISETKWVKIFNVGNLCLSRFQVEDIQFCEGKSSHDTS